MSRTKILWIVWVLLTLTAGGYAAAVIFEGGNRDFLLIGRTTDGHHQIELSCDACHTSAFGGEDDLQKACVNCHGAELKTANDSHPKSKFTNPRNADRVAKLDARYCVTCHREHKPDITNAMAVTMPDDYCFLCHEDIAKDRPSHAGLPFDGCATAGCHNFHDNRALYEDFLEKHIGADQHLPVQKVALKIWTPPETDAKPAKPLTAAAMDAPSYKAEDPKIVTAWAETAHAASGVNCSGCHTKRTDPDNWIERPGMAVCAACHKDQQATFVEGKHGMRLRDGLFVSARSSFGLFDATPMPPMTPGEARLPMKADAHGTAIGCETCHVAHGYDAAKAQVDACMGCHDDAHTKAYPDSPHAAAWQVEAQGLAPKGTGVSCATCHLPRVQHKNSYGEERVFVTHNQNDNLRPNEKMVRGVCLDCHGLEFTLDALADPALIANNFKGQPSRHVESIDWVAARLKKRGKAQ